MSSIEAPGGLADLQRFVNTIGYDRGGVVTDELVGADPGLLAFRGALRDILAANAGHADREHAWAALQPFAAASPMRLDFSGAPRLEPLSPTADATIGALLAVVYDAVRDGTWIRLKICRESDCLWAFYDRSKNGSGVWCSMNVCGNRAKARRRRDRIKSG